MTEHINLIKLIPDYRGGRIRYFANGKSVSRGRYRLIVSAATTMECFQTERTILRHGLIAWRHRCIARVVVERKP